MNRHEQWTIGEVARRSGVPPSALRYYESLGLIASTRSGGDRRRYRRAVLRRIAVIRAAQHVGLSLAQVQASLADLAPDAAPTKKQWARISAAWRPLLDQRISDLLAVRDNLSNCVGCGCLSMRQCGLYNADDTLGDNGFGARRLFPAPVAPGPAASVVVATTPAAGSSPTASRDS